MMFLEIFFFISYCFVQACLPYWSFVCTLWFPVSLFMVLTVGEAGSACVCVSRVYCLFCFILLFYCPVCFLEREKESIELEGLGSRNDLGGETEI